MAKNDNDLGEEIKDPLEVMDEADDEADETDPDKLIKSGMHIEGEDDAGEIDPDALGVTALEDDPLAFDPLLIDDSKKPEEEDEEVDGEVDLVDEEFEDDKDNW